MTIYGAIIVTLIMVINFFILVGISLIYDKQKKIEKNLDDRNIILPKTDLPKITRIPKNKE